MNCRLTRSSRGSGRKTTQSRVDDRIMWFNSHTSYSFSDLEVNRFDLDGDRVELVSPNLDNQTPHSGRCDMVCFQEPRNAGSADRVWSDRRPTAPLAAGRVESSVQTRTGRSCQRLAETDSRPGKLLGDDRWWTARLRIKKWGRNGTRRVNGVRLEESDSAMNHRCRLTLDTGDRSKRLTQDTGIRTVLVIMTGGETRLLGGSLISTFPATAIALSLMRATV